MKKIIVGLLMLIPLRIVSGQDKIITIQHDTIHCRIISVSSAHIHYEQKAENGYMIGKFIPTEQVLTYLRTPQRAKNDSYDRAGRQKPKPARRWLIGIHPGGSYTLASTVNDENGMIEAGMSQSQVDNYIKQIKHGWNFSGDIHYLLSDYFAIGARYSLFTMSAQQDFAIKIDDYFPEFLCVGMKEKLNIHYAGPSILFRQWLDKNQKFQLIETVSAGYVHYRCEERMDLGLQKVNLLAEGNTWGANAVLSIGYFPVSWLSIGLNAGFMYARLTKIDLSTINGTETVKLVKNDYEYLTRLDYSLNIRFHF